MYPKKYQKDSFLSFDIPLSSLFFPIICLQIFRYQPQLFRSGFCFAAPADIQLIQNMADVRFYRRKLDIHNLPDFGIAFIRTD